MELNSWAGLLLRFFLGTTITTPIWSKLGEIIGNKKAYMVTSSLFAIGSFLQGMAPNMVFLIIARIIAGIGSGGMVSLPFIIYADLYKDLNTRTKVLGMATASFSIASIIGPLLGGWLVDSLSWHWIFYINVPVAFLSIVIVEIFFKEDKVVNKYATNFDYLGVILMVASLVSLLFSFEMVGDILITYLLILVILSIILGTLFFKRERVAEDPIIPIRLFKNRKLVTSFVLFALIWGAFIAFNVYVPMWAQRIIGTSAIIGGATQIPSAITNFFGSESVSYLKSRFKDLSIIRIGIISIMISFSFFVLVNKNIGIEWIYVASLFEGLGLGLCFTVLQVKVQNDADQRDVPVATSFSFLIRTISQTFTASLFGTLLNHSLKAGTQNSNGHITMKMMNLLGNLTAEKSITHVNILEMRTILYGGLRNVMFLSIIILVVALVVTYLVPKSEKNY